MIDFLDLLACPVCAGALSSERVDAEHGWLACNACISLAPVVFGMVLFTETRHGGSVRPDIHELAAQLAGTEADYQVYIDDKRNRGLVDAYAAFEPFNESMRCASPILRAARESMGAGDAVLDLGIRSGWSGAMLAGLFPRQRVVSICWNGAGGLGYRGFRQWFSGVNRIENLLVVFSPMTDALPVRDGAFALVHSYDSLHRTQSPMLCNGALKAAKPDATIVHAHVHLADAEPEPWFERGGILRKAAEYRSFFASRLQGDPRKTLLVAESALFAAIRAGEIDWDALEKARGYNGFIATAASATYEAAKRRASIWPDPGPGDRMLVNPLLRINPLTGAVRIDETTLGGRAREMLMRHPPFAEALRSHRPDRLDGQSIALLSMAEAGATIADSAQRLGLPVDEMLARVALLAQQEILIAAPFARSYHSLYRFHDNHRSALDRDFARVLAEWVAESPDAPGGTIFGNEVARRETVLILSALTDYLHRIPIGRGDAVAIVSAAADALWPIAACLLAGASVDWTDPGNADGIAVRMAIVDRPAGRCPIEFCTEGDVAAPVTLAKVLSAYVDEDSQAAFAVGGNEHAMPAHHWTEFIRTDAQGRLLKMKEHWPSSPSIDTDRRG
jgi:hypothetical protein